jgi:type IV pilus assembly protein PilY1
VPTTYLSGAQALYGLWDSNMSAWNAKSSTKFATLSTTQTIVAANLETQVLTENTDASGNVTSVDVTSNPVCWSGSATCPSGNTQFGWTAALPGAGEQVVFNPLLYGNAFTVNTTMAAVNSPKVCAETHETGSTIAIALTTGGASGIFKNTTDTNAAGGGTNGTGTPFVVQAGGYSFLLTQTLGDADSSSGSGPVGAGVNPFVCSSKICETKVASPTVNGKRLTWVQRR